jgi:glutathione S-transferase
MASRIALYAAGGEARFIQVDTRAKRVLEDGGDFRAVNPLGQVPVLRTDAGALLTENGAILQHIAECHPEAGLLPPEGPDRDRLRQWLSFTATELHKQVFTPLLDPAANEGAKAFARAKAPERMAVLEAHLAGRDWLLERFGVADAYLATVLNWAAYAGLDLSAWPVVQAWWRRALRHPPVTRALAEERALYAEEQARRAAA